MLPDPLKVLQSMIDPGHLLPEEAWSDFAACWKPHAAKRKEIVSLAGEREKSLYFVIEGVQRVFYLDDKNREATLVFTYAPSFGGVLDSFLLQQPSRYCYETLTPSRFLKISFADFQQQAKKYPVLDELIKIGLAQTLSGVLERLAELQCFSSEDRFKSLLARSPHILQLVPHKYLANYLGIDATNFSKHINKIRI